MQTRLLYPSTLPFTLRQVEGRTALRAWLRRPATGPRGAAQAAAGGGAVASGPGGGGIPGGVSPGRGAGHPGGDKGGVSQDRHRSELGEGKHETPSSFTCKPRYHISNRELKKLSAWHTNYTTVYFSLTAEQARKLREAAKKVVVTESEALRGMLDAHLAEIEKRGLPYEPCRKMQFKGYEERVVPRTIRREQDTRLRELSERTGRSLSELVREAVELETVP